MPDNVAVNKGEPNHVGIPSPASESNLERDTGVANELGLTLDASPPPAGPTASGYQATLRRLPSAALRQRAVETLGRHAGNSYLQHVLAHPTPPGSGSGERVLAPVLTQVRPLQRNPATAAADEVSARSC